MGRFPQPLAEKGSKKWIQKLINEQPELLSLEIREKLDLPNNDEIRWSSPLKSDEYAEYSDQDFINLLCSRPEKIPLQDFWPKGGPHWDALGKSKSGKLFLIEAKSHISELLSILRAKDKDSLIKIHKSLNATRAFLKSNTQTDWSRGFFQYTNRLAHLYLLRKNGLPAYLVFIYFINDSDMKGPKTADEWKAALKLLHSYLGIRRHRFKKFIAEIFIEVNLLR